MKFFEQWWFKWAAVGVSLVLIASIFGSGIWSQYQKQKAFLEAKLEAYRVQREYEDRFQSWMTRIYQNLKLEHYLAAYQNARKMPQPKHDDRQRVDEFLEALHRIAEGLLASNLFKESEEIFSIMREFEPDSKKASEGLTEIESKRRLASAQFHLNEVEQLLEKKDYRNAMADLQKADIELNATYLRDMTPVVAEKERLSSMMKTARYYVLVGEAEKAVSDARSALQYKRFDEVQKAMAVAARKVGVAAFYNNLGLEVRKVRDDLHALAADLAYEVPNASPVWNRWNRDYAGRADEFFYLVDYHFDLVANENSEIRIGMDYMRHRDERSYVVRYRVYLDDGSSFFNGHFLVPVNTTNVDTDVSSIIYEQEVPEAFRSRKIQRVELNVYTEKNVLLSRVMRAFKM